MRNILLSFFLISLPWLTLHAQDLPENTPGKWVGLLHVEFGAIYPDGKIRESISVRQNISSYYVDQVSNGSISSETYGVVLGLKWEYFNTRLKTGISTGVRYTGFRSEITGYSSDRANFFYLRYSMVNTDTKFARVKNISESNNFISIPLELRFIPFKFQNFGLFGKVGIEFSNFNLKKETDINFQEKTMESYQDEILDNIGISSNNFYSTLYGSVGFLLGKENKTNYIFEVFLPSLFLSRNNFALTEVDYYAGFKFSVQFQVKKPK
ncbi:MAG: hypothetical protein JXJ22_18100 [Bacteroidales bacterium]|nr:hypothetical protein [Bacteroidales bacterium]